MLDALGDVSLWPYLAAAAVVAADAVLPLIPGETAVIAAAVLASQGDLSIAAVIAAAVAGSLVGDSASYGLGATVGRRAERRIRSGSRRRRALDGLIDQLGRRAPAILVAARFVPGGRTAATFTTGAAGLRFGAFAGPALLGAVLWSLYAAGLGYLGGEAFTGSLWMPLAAALVVAGAVAAAGEAYRRLRLAT